MLGVFVAFATLATYVRLIFQGFEAILLGHYKRLIEVYVPYSLLDSLFSAMVQWAPLLVILLLIQRQLLLG
ncbi:hypothetical protein D8S78_20670 [Natrialba swarupiae]|nr:hypothetical protein [Natrialba swarupiae]